MKRRNFVKSLLTVPVAAALPKVGQEQITEDLAELESPFITNEIEIEFGTLVNTPVGGGLKFVVLDNNGRVINDA